MSIRRRYGRSVRRTGMLLALLAVLAAPSLLSAAPALAASCWASSCNHLDPQTNGCGADAESLVTFTPVRNSYDVQLRKSSACHAAWARVTNVVTEEPRYKYLKLQVWDAPTGGTLLWTETRYIPHTVYGQDYWTAMGTFNYWVQACVKNENDYGHCSVRR